MTLWYPFIRWRRNQSSKGLSHNLSVMVQGLKSRSVWLHNTSSTHWEIKLLSQLVTLTRIHALCHVTLQFLPQKTECTSVVDFGLSHVTWFSQSDMCRYDTNIGLDVLHRGCPLAIQWLPRKQHALAGLLNPRGGKGTRRTKPPQPACKLVSKYSLFVKCHWYVDVVCYAAIANWYKNYSLLSPEYHRSLPQLWGKFCSFNSVLATNIYRTKTLYSHQHMEDVICLSPSDILRHVGSTSFIIMFKSLAW